jgi:hypothetical protein
VLQKLKENGRNIDEIIIQDGNLYGEMKKIDPVDLEIKGMSRYFELEEKRDKEGLNPKEEKEIFTLSVKYQNAMTLEEAHKRLKNNNIPLSVLNLLKNKYKKELMDKITSKGLNPSDFVTTEEKEEQIKKEEVKEEKKIDESKLSKQDKDFARYLSLIDKKELTTEEKNELKILKIVNQHAMTLEEAKKRVEAGTVPEAVYTTLYNKYKEELESNMKEVGATLEQSEEPIKEEVIDDDIGKLKEENKLLKEKISNLESKLKAIIEELK